MTPDANEDQASNAEYIHDSKASEAPSITHAINQGFYDGRRYRGCGIS
jgi:hypothetical protein